MLQCVLPGKAQDVYLSLSARDCSRYSMVKSAVLKAYELVLEAQFILVNRKLKLLEKLMIMFYPKEGTTGSWVQSGIGVFLLLGALRSL